MILGKNIQIPAGQEIGEISDGWHTFDDLYEFRKVYNALLFNEWAHQDMYKVHKSRKHNDGEYPFGNPKWFIVSALLPGGKLISNHYHIDDWDLFNIDEVPQALFCYDGYTSADVLNRLKSLL